MADDALTRELLELERHGWEALREGTGADFYGSVMTDDGVMVLANGAVADRDAVVESLRGSPPFAGAMTSTYVRGDDGWRLALYTQTPIP
jgi:hypothetical protein